VDGTRFGLTKRVQRRYRNNTLYESLPDLLVLLTGLDNDTFRRAALVVENADAVTRATEDGGGAIIAGFRIGPHATLPYALSAIGHDVSMIVSSAALADGATKLGAEFAPRSSRNLKFMAADDALVLSRAQRELRVGRLVCTLMDFPAQKFQKTSRVRFLDWKISAPYGIPYLSAMTVRSIIPAIITRHKGPRFKLRFLDPIAAPSRQRSSVLDANQALYSELDRQVRRFPAQWVGWTLLESHMGIDLTPNPSRETAKPS
jgi:lauroyl/myristoyl acyltransferase